MKAPSCALAAFPRSGRAPTAGSCCGRHDPRQHRVLPVVADVGDPVGPAHHLALGRGRRRPATSCGWRCRRLSRAHRFRGASETERTPRRVVEASGHVGVERVLAGVATGPVAAVVPERDGLGERDVEPQRPGDGARDLGHLERVGQPGALVVLGEHEDLGLARQATERRWRGGCGRGRARSRSATRRVLRAAAVRRHRRRGWRRARAASPRVPRARRGRRATRVLGAPTWVRQAPDRYGRASRRVPGAQGRRSPPSSLPSGRCVPSRRARRFRSCHAVSRVAVTSRRPGLGPEAATRGVTPGGRAYRHHPHPQGARGGDARGRRPRHPGEGHREGARRRATASSG